MTRRHLLLAAAALLFAAFAVRYRAYLIDDAYISLRYSLNLVDGHGLVFNPGERVEGYTNFLWVLLGAAFLALGIDAMTALKVVSVLAAAVLVAVLRRLEKRVGRGPLPAVLFLLTLEGWGYWVTTGMETTLFAALLGAGLALAIDEGHGERFGGAAVLFLAAALTRPEGVLAFGLGTLAAFALARVHRGVWAWRTVLRDALVFGLPGALYFIWRWQYFGDLLPNTFRAKVTGGWEQWRNGFLNLGQWSLHHPLFALALLVPAILFFTHRERLRQRPELLTVWAFTWCWVLYVVSVGGDFMPFWRFFVPLLVPCAVLLGGVWNVLAEIHPRWATAPVVALALAVHLVANLWSDEPYRAFVAHRTTVVGEQVGNYFEGVLGEDEWLAVNTAGSLPYASRRPTIDMLGLTDRQIARHPVYVVSLGWAGHRRGWGDYVVSRRPRAVVWYNSAGLAEPHYLGDHQLADNPFFRFFYQMRREVLPAPEERVLARFLGNPFEVGEDKGTGRMPELGIELVLEDGPLPYTVVRTAPTVLHYFELRSDREALWDAGRRHEDDITAFLDEAVALWRRQLAERGPGDPRALQQVEALCRQAADFVQQGQVERARQVLSRAVTLNGAARSPLVYQYVTNLAVMDGSLFLAVHAQQEALRLAPDNVLYRRNLENLLRTPFKDFKAGPKG